MRHLPSLLVVLATALAHPVAAIPILPTITIRYGPRGVACAGATSADPQTVSTTVAAPSESIRDHDANVQIHQLPFHSLSKRGGEFPHHARFVSFDAGNRTSDLALSPTTSVTLSPSGISDPETIALHQEHGESDDRGDDRGRGNSDTDRPSDGRPEDSDVNNFNGGPDREGGGERGPDRDPNGLNGDTNGNDPAPESPQQANANATTSCTETSTAPTASAVTVTVIPLPATESTLPATESASPEASGTNIEPSVTEAPPGIQTFPPTTVLSTDAPADPASQSATAEPISTITSVVVPLPLPSVTQQFSTINPLPDTAAPPAETATQQFSTLNPLVASEAPPPPPSTTPGPEAQGLSTINPIPNLDTATVQFITLNPPPVTETAAAAPLPSVSESPVADAAASPPPVETDASLSALATTTSAAESATTTSEATITSTTTSVSTTTTPPPPPPPPPTSATATASSAAAVDTAVDAPVITPSNLPFIVTVGGDSPAITLGIGS